VYPQDYMQNDLINNETTSLGSGCGLMDSLEGLVTVWVYSVFDTGGVTKCL